MKTWLIRLTGCALLGAAPMVAAQTAQEYFDRGTALVEQKRLQDALREFNRATAVQPDFAPAYRALGFLRQDLGDNAGSLREFDRYLSLAPADSVALNARCYLRTEAGDLEGALTDCDRCLKWDPRNALAYNNRGRIKSRRGDDPGALADYSAAIQLNPASGMSYRNRGLVLKRMGDLDGAQRDFEKAIEVDPGYTRARTSLETLKAERAAAASAAGAGSRGAAGTLLPPPPAMDSNDGITAPVPRQDTAPPGRPIALPPPPPIESDTPRSTPTGDVTPVEEALALGRIRSVLSAQETFLAIHGSFAREIRCLVEPPSCPDSAGTRESLLDRSFLDGERSGYRFSLHATDPAESPSGASAVLAIPLKREGPGRALCGHVTMSGGHRLCAIPSGTPLRILGGRCPAECASIR